MTVVSRPQNQHLTPRFCGGQGQSEHRRPQGPCSCHLHPSFRRGGVASSTVVETEAPPSSSLDGSSSVRELRSFVSLRLRSCCLSQAGASAPYASEHCQSSTPWLAWPDSATVTSCLAPGRAPTAGQVQRHGSVSHDAASTEHGTRETHIVIVFSLTYCCPASLAAVSSPDFRTNDLFDAGIPAGLAVKMRLVCGCLVCLV